MQAGQELMAQRRFAEARAAFAEAVAQEPSLIARRWLARAARLQGDHQSALALWRGLAREAAAPESAPDDIEPELRIAEALANLGREAEALDAARALLARLPGDVRALRPLARLLQHAGALCEAFSHWHSLARIDAADAEALFRAGQLALALGEAADGEALLRQAIALPDSDPRATASLARHLGWTERTAEACALLRAALRRRPEDESLHRTRFELLRVAGHEARIARYFARLRGVSPDPDARLRLADRMLAAEDVAAARALLEELDTEPAAARLAALALQEARPDAALRAIARCGAPATLRAEIDAATDWARTLGAAPDGLASALVDHLLAAPPPALHGRPGSVLHVVNSLAMGGSERQCVSVAMAQSGSDAPGSRGGQITVLRTDPGRAGRAAFFQDTLAQAGVTSATLEEFALASRAEALPEALRVPHGRLGNVLVPRHMAPLLRAIRAIRPETIMVWSPQIMSDVVLAGLALGVKRILLRSGSVALPSREALTGAEAARIGLWRETLRAGLRHHSVWLLNNCQANLDDWLAWLGLAPDDIGGRCAVLPNLVDPRQFPPRPAGARERLRNRLGIAAGRPVIGSVMRMEREKGVDLWLDTVAAVARTRPDIVFVALGGGRLLDAVRDGARMRGLADQVRLPGSVATGLPDHYAIFDALLMTSAVEGLPNAVIEAQCYGLPVIAPRIGGIPAAVAPDLPHSLLASRTAADYATAVIATLSSPSAPTERMAIGRRFVAGAFSPEAVVTRLIRLRATTPALALPASPPTCPPPVAPSASIAGDGARKQRKRVS